MVLDDDPSQVLGFSAQDNLRIGHASSIDFRLDAQDCARSVGLFTRHHLKTYRYPAQIIAEYVNHDYRVAAARDHVAILGVGIELRLIERDVDQSSAYLAFARIVRSAKSMGPRGHRAQPSYHREYHDREAASGTGIEHRKNQIFRFAH